MKTSADSLKKSADALNASSLWEKKKIKKKDEETGEETEVEDYDWEAITKVVKSFIEDYNDVVKEAGESNTKDVLKKSDISSLKSVFTGYNSYASKISQKATNIGNAANRAIATYTNNGTYSKVDSYLTSSKIDKEV